MSAENSIAHLAQVAAEEAELVFPSFNSADALALGMALVARAQTEQKTISIHISVNRRQVFHYAFDGTAPNNDHWIMGKENTVYHFFKSSRQMELRLILEKNGGTLTSVYGLDGACFKASGGSFPVTVAGCGVVGAITVSGMAGHEDHAYVVDAIRTYLQHE